MGICVMWWKFEHGPPPLQQLAERLQARCGLTIVVERGDSNGGILAVDVLHVGIDITIDGNTVELTLGALPPVFIWIHLEAALAELGGVCDTRYPPPEALPAWMSLPWQQIGPWRRWAMLHPFFMELVLPPLVNVHHWLRRLVRRHPPGPGDR